MEMFSAGVGGGEEEGRRRDVKHVRSSAAGARMTTNAPAVSYRSAVRQMQEAVCVATIEMQQDASTGGGGGMSRSFLLRSAAVRFSRAWALELPRSALLTHP